MAFLEMLLSLIIRVIGVSVVKLAFCAGFVFSFAYGILYLVHKEAEEQNKKKAIIYLCIAAVMLYFVTMR